MATTTEPAGRGGQAEPGLPSGRTALGGSAGLTPAPRRGRRGGRSALARGEGRAAWAFISPWVIGFVVFTAGPMIASLVLSFTDYEMIRAPHGVGAANYRDLIQDPKIVKSLLNTFIYALIFVPTGTIVALGLAMMLHKVGRAAGFFRTAFYLPVMTPAVAASAMFLLLLNGQRGLINQVLGWVGIQGPNWTTDPAWLKPSIAIVSLWSVGGSVVIYLAALKNVPQQLYEAAAIDGAGPVTRFTRITLPMISGALFFTIITHTIAALQMFDQAYTMFYGPQQKATASEESLVYMIYLFQNAFQFFKMGYASAMAWLLFLIILAITLIRTQAVEQAVEPPAATPTPDQPDAPWWRRLPFYLGLTLATVAFCYPLVWLVSASLKPKSQVFDNRLIPEVFQPSNYVEVWKTAPVLNWLFNSLTVGIMAAGTVTLSSAAVAFGFAYFRFRLRKPLFGLILATMMLPGAVTMIPVYLIWNRLGFIDTQIPLWAQNLFGSAFYIFLLRQFFLGIPRELFEAARVDGCGYFGLFRRIALPLCRPALVIVFIFEFQASWSDLMKPLIYLQTPEFFTMPRGLKQLVDAFALSGEYHWEIAMAASVIATIPMIILFALGQRHILDGVATTAQKG